jgi:regulator of protease activity HflC (stomatin/prohibitin superfamily)
MLDKLIDLLVQFVELGQIFFYVDHYNKAVVLRFGKYHRTVGPGPHWMLPLGVEEIMDVNVKPEPQYLDTQSVHTKDEYLVNVGVGYTIRVTEPRTFLLEYEETDQAIALLISGLVYEALRASTWKEVHDGTWFRGLKAKANKKARKRGALIEELVIHDLASGDANRLWVEGIEL